MPVLGVGWGGGIKGADRGCRGIRGLGLHLKNEDGILCIENVLLKTQDGLLNTEDNRNELRSTGPM